MKFKDILKIKSIDGYEVLLVERENICSTYKITIILKTSEDYNMEFQYFYGETREEYMKEICEYLKEHNVEFYTR